MKTKILNYNHRDQVKLVTKDLKPIEGHPYAFTFFESESFGMKQVGFVLKVSDNIYITEGYYNEKTILDNIGLDDRAKNRAENYFNLSEQEARPSLMMIEAYKMKGLDTEPLFQKRADFDAQKSLERAGKAKRQAEQEESKANEYRKEMEAIKAVLISPTDIAGKPASELTVS